MDNFIWVLNHFFNFMFFGLAIYLFYWDYQWLKGIKKYVYDIDYNEMRTFAWILLAIGAIALVIAFII